MREAYVRDRALAILSLKRSWKEPYLHNVMNLPSMTIPSGETGSMTESCGERRTKHAHWALDIATFKRFGESKNSMPRGRSSLDEVAIDTKTIGAS